MALIKDRPARVRGVVQDKGPRLAVDERGQVVEVRLPVAVGQKVVLFGVDPEAVRQGGIEGKA